MGPPGPLELSALTATIVRSFGFPGGSGTVKPEYAAKRRVAKTPLTKTWQSLRQPSMRRKEAPPAAAGSVNEVRYQPTPFGYEPCMMFERLLTARAKNRRFWLLSALRAHTKAPHKIDLHKKTLRALNRPEAGADSSRARGSRARPR